jgi:hypothetical protein
VVCTVRRHTVPGLGWIVLPGKQPPAHRPNPDDHVASLTRLS